MSRITPVPYSPGPWTPVTYVTDVTNQSATYRGIEVRLENGICRFRGRGLTVVLRAAGDVLFTVPAAFRPSVQTYSGLINSSQGVVVKTNGDVVTAASLGAAATLQLEGVTYSL